MTTINISLPEKLKSQAEELIKEGFFVSFSDLVRHSIREIVNKNKYDLWYEEALEDERNGKGVLLKTAKDIDNFTKNL